MQAEAICGYLGLYKLAHANSQKGVLQREGVFRNIFKATQSAPLKIRSKILRELKDFLSIWTVGRELDSVRYVLDGFGNLLTTPFSILEEEGIILKLVVHLITIWSQD